MVLFRNIIITMFLKSNLLMGWESWIFSAAITQKASENMFFV